MESCDGQFRVQPAFFLCGCDTTKLVIHGSNEKLDRFSHASSDYDLYVRRFQL